MFLVNDRGPLTQRKASVQKLKSKQLTEFIEKGALTDSNHVKKSDSSSENSSKSSNNGSAIDNSIIEGQKYSLINLGSNVIPTNDLGITEAPLLFVGKGSVRLAKGTTKLQDIIDSYKLFKEMHTELEFQNYIQEENADFM